MPKGSGLSWEFFRKYLHQRIYKLTNKYYKFGIGEEICAAALYEMTFHGYTEEKVEKEYSYLEKKLMN